MNSEEFVEKIKLYVRDAAVEDVISKLENVPGRKPRQKHVLQSKWYNSLSQADKQMISQVLGEAIDEALFGFFAVLDGVRIIDESQLKGRIELKYKNEEGEEVLNNPENEFLHDIYNWLTNQV